MIIVSFGVILGQVLIALPDNTVILSFVLILSILALFMSFAILLKKLNGFPHMNCYVILEIVFSIFAIILAQVFVRTPYNKTVQILFNTSSFMIFGIALLIYLKNIKQLK